MRALATDDYDENGVTFDLEAEQARLEKWLSIEGNRERLAREPLCIYVFNWLGAEQGGPLSRNLAWLPRRILASSWDERMWEYSMAMSSPEDRVVALFSEEEWNEGSRPPQAEESLIEFLPINMHDIHFTQDDLDRELIRVTQANASLPSILYYIKADRQDAYADWTERLIGKKAAIVVNGVALSAPVFRGRIPGVGQLSGGFTEEEAAALAASLRASVGTGDEGSVAAEVMIAATPDDPWNALAYAYRLLHGQDEQIRLEAAASLGGFGEQAKQTVPQLVEALGDESVRVRGEIITALGMIGPAAEDAIPVLERLSTQDDSQIAGRAKAALRQIRGS